MARTNLRQIPRMEALESRMVLSEAGPSAEAQLALELLNEARVDPAAAAERATQQLDDATKEAVAYYRVNLAEVKAEIQSLPAQPPLAWDADLAEAATAQSADMARKGFQSHTGSDGSSLGDRINRTDYDGRGLAENAFAYAESVDHAMKAFLVDWGVAGDGHRNNILQPGKTGDDVADEVGVGIVGSKRFGFGPQVVTQVFGRDSDPRANLVGVAYDDRDGDDFYTPGEGLGGVDIKLTHKQTGETASTSTMAAGGYQIALEPGKYDLTAKLGTQVVKKAEVAIADKNVKVDIVLGEAPAVTPAAPAPSKPVLDQPQPLKAALPLLPALAAASARPPVVAVKVESQPAPQVAPPKVETPKPVEAPKVDLARQVVAARVETPKVEARKVEAPKVDPVVAKTPTRSETKPLVVTAKVEPVAPPSKVLPTATPAATASAKPTLILKGDPARALTFSGAADEAESDTPFDESWITNWVSWKANGSKARIER